MTEEQSLLKFPCQFPIKVMGKAGDEFEIDVLTIVRKYAPDLAENSIKINNSQAGTYAAITITIEAHSQEQLDNIYGELTVSEHVIMAL